MKWWEFIQDNGDGSYSKRRYRTLEEAKEAFAWLEKNRSWFQSDGGGVSEIDTDDPWFFETLEDTKEDFS